MKRELRFRGQNIAEDWFYGGVGFNNEGIQNFIKSPYNLIEVKPETVGQFTGLFDIAGKPIYEDDCLELNTETRSIWKVIWSNSLCRFRLTRIGKEHLVMDLTYNVIKEYSAVVDGNIFDDLFRYMALCGGKQ